MGRKWFEMKNFTSNHFRTHAQRETEIAPFARHEPRSPFDFDFELHPDRTLRLCTLRLRRLRMPSTSSRLHPKIARLRLCRPRTLRLHRLRRDGTDRTEIAIEKWLGFDEFDQI